MTTKEALKILEHLYDLVLDIEQLRREQSNLNAEDPEAVEAWYAHLNTSFKGPLIPSKERKVFRTRSATMGRSQGHGTFGDKASYY